MKHSNVRKIAKFANLSPATVSRYLNGYTYVSTEAKAKIRQAISEINSSDSQTEKMQINVLICTPASKQAYDFYHDVIQELWQLGAKEGLTLSYMTLREDEKDARSLFKSTYKEMDIVVCVGGAFSPDTLSQICEFKPVILIDNDHPSAHTVSIDNQQGTSLAVHHLYEMGHRRIGFLGASETHASLSKRYNGYLKSIRELNLSPLASFYQGGSFFDEGIIMTEQLLKENSSVTALIAGGEMITYGALNALSRHNLKVPEDVSLIGFGIREGEYGSNLGISTISLMPEAISLFVVELIKMIERGRIRYPVRTYLLPEICLNETCKSITFKVDQMEK